jgi:poly(3-hydroxybutyrate) depolymerase
MAAQIPPGSSSFPFRDIIVHIHRPPGFTLDSPILVVMHGRKRNGDEYRDYFVGESERRGFLVVAPQFAEAEYPHPHAYNYGRMVDADGHPLPLEKWIFSTVEAVFLEVRARTASRRDRFFLFGHSAGSQFVHRLATFAWNDSIEKAVAANAGSYTMPLRGERFPFGLDQAPITEEERAQLFSRPLVVLLGDRDIDTRDPDLPTEPEAMRQGPFRLARGQNYFETASREAARLGVPFNWRLAIAPGVAHSGKDMAPFAVRELGL